MTGRASRALLGALMVVTWAFAGAPATGQEGTPCTGELDFTISPGLTNTPSSGTVSTHGETGFIECRGKVNGKEATGQGTWGFEGKYGTKDPDTCAGGEGTSTHSITIPTSQGDEHVIDPLEYTYAPLQGGVYGGEIKGSRLTGTFEATPTEGDCVTKPLTEVHIVFDATLKS